MELNLSVGDYVVVRKVCVFFCELLHSCSVSSLLGLNISMMTSNAWFKMLTWFNFNRESFICQLRLFVSFLNDPLAFLFKMNHFPFKFDHSLSVFGFLSLNSSQEWGFLRVIFTTVT